MTMTPGKGSETEEKLRILTKIIRDHAPVVIAYSGGVDSTLLAILAQEEAGPEGLFCVLVTGPQMPKSEAEAAIRMARSYHLPLRVMDCLPLPPDIMASNPTDRCYHCKMGLFPALKAMADEISAGGILDGANASDLSEYRPGIEAFTSCGVIHPFITAGITKEEIREIAQSRDLPVWNKPSAACLVSRIPYGEPITGEKLERIAISEAYLRDLGATQVRVRHHENTARIEVLIDELDLIIAHREEIIRRFRAAGFTYVTLDLAGYRSGSLDEVIPA